jgi:imidazolonepropionase-like amidohydrolase
MLVSGQVSMRVKGPEEARQAAREQIEAGFDIIKMTGSARLRFDELKAVVEEAEAAGKPTATHALGAPGVKDAIRAGVRSIEHGYYLDDEGIAMMVERGTFLVPTLASVHLMVQRGSGAGIPSFMMEMAKRAAEEHPASFRRAWEAGVRIAAGNDGGTPFNPASNLASELERLVAAGLTPAQALDAAQGTAAELLKLTDRIGTVEAGKLADLVVLDADPLVDISNVRRVSMVFKGGWQVPNPGLPAALRSALEEAA